MKVVRDLDKLAQQLTGCVVAIGNFDGVHKGHQQLLRAAISLAKQHDKQVVLMTFEPHPVEYFQPDRQYIRLQSLRDKYHALQSNAMREAIGGNVDYLYCHRFNAQTASMLPEQFVLGVLLQKLKAKAVVVGDDFCFGVNRTGNVALLQLMSQAHNFILQQVPAQCIDDQRVSSSRIRLALQSGDMRLAEHMLGVPYTIYGRIVFGDQRGRQWGFPTANIRLHRRFPPLSGIYAVEVGLGHHQTGRRVFELGVASIGFRPTFKVERPLLEVFILNFDRDIYGQLIQVRFLHKIRPEQHFSSVDLLVARMHEDVVQARAFFAEEHNI